MTSLKQISSSSMTAISARGWPPASALAMSVEAMPVPILPPARFVTSIRPLSKRISAIRFVVVVLPFVPDTNTRCSGIGICARKSGSIFSAMTPGSCPPTCPVFLSTPRTSFEAASAQRNLMGEPMRDAATFLLLCPIASSAESPGHVLATAMLPGPAHRLHRPAQMRSRRADNLFDMP